MLNEDIVICLRLSNEELRSIDDFFVMESTRESITIRHSKHEVKSKAVAKAQRKMYDGVKWSDGRHNTKLLLRWVIRM